MTEKPKPIVTMDELATLANVSVSTVSRALAGSSLVNAKTRNRIIALAEQHQFQVNEQARNFRLKKNGVISVVMMADAKSGQHVSDMFFLEMLGALADSLSANGYDLLLAHVPVEEVNQVHNHRAWRQSDGMMFVGQGTQHDYLNELADRGKPLVVWGAGLADTRYCCVGIDNELGGYLATRHLLNLGRERIAFFGDRQFPEPQLRFHGYLRALAEKGIEPDPALHHAIPFDMAHANVIIADLLQGKLAFDSVFCCSDLIAISAIDAISEYGLRIPEDIAVVGFDDITLATYSRPPLTTVRQNIAQGGRIMVRKLLAQVNGEAVTPATLKTELVVRRSSGAW